MQVNRTRMWRVRAVAEMFDVSASTIYRAIEAGKLDALKIGTGKGAIRVPEYAVQAYAEECAEGSYRAFVVDGESVEGAESEVSGEVAR